jgi:hypothetical protein
MNHQIMPIWNAEVKDIFDFFSNIFHSGVGMMTGEIGAT